MNQPREGSIMEINDVDLTLQEEARYLSQQLFGKESPKSIDFTDRLLDIYNKAQGKDFLLIHTSGGWGSAGAGHCLQWERSLVAGINATIEKLGYTPLLIQYFRTGLGWQEKIQDAKEQFQFFPVKATLMAAKLKFLTQHTNTLKIILIGVSQGAAFGNAVMQCLANLNQVYSIEVGMPFYYNSRRVTTERTSVLDSNGVMPDAIVQRNPIGGLKAYLIGPVKWLIYQLQGRPERFAQCINAPGHDYDWKYPKVRQQIENFLEVNFGSNTK